MSSSYWSKLHYDLLTCIFQHLNFIDFHRAKIVCSRWYSASKHTTIQKRGSPWLMLFPEHDNCMLYNPEEHQIYKSFVDYSEFRFLANSGKWFLVIDSRFNLCIIDLFSREKINLPLLESLQTKEYNLRRIGDKEFKAESVIYNVEMINGLLWIDEKNKDNYVVVWYFWVNSSPRSLAYCKNGDKKYTELPIQFGIRHELQTSFIPMLLKDYKLFIDTSKIRNRIKTFDLSGENIQDVSQNWEYPLTISKGSLNSPEFRKSKTRNLAVTLSGEILLILGIIEFPPTRTKIRVLKFKLYEDDRKQEHPDVRYIRTIEEDFLGNDEGLLVDLGGTVHVNDAVGIEPDSVYFSTGGNRVDDYSNSVDFGVYNLGTKVLKRFPRLLNMNLKDARWFIPTFG